MYLFKEIRACLKQKKKKHFGGTDFGMREK